MKMSKTNEKEQKTLESRVTELLNMITSEQEANVNADRFLNLVKKYTDIHEMTAEIIREFVERIYVHQTEGIDGKLV